MKKIYFLTIAFVMISGFLNAQIVQMPKINPTNSSAIANLYSYKGEVYFRATDGTSIGKELYKIAADGTVQLVKDINTDPSDATPDGNPKNFFEYNGLLYFNANDGDVSADKHKTELWVTDGSAGGTQMIADIFPGGGTFNGSDPQQMFVFNGKLYFQAKSSMTTAEFWRYDGINPPKQITSIRADGLAVPIYPTVDEANGKTYFKVSVGAYELGILNADETWQVIDMNPGTTLSDHGFDGSTPGKLYHGKFYFDGDNGTSGDELFVSDGTIEGTKLVKDIFTGGNSDPRGFVIYNDELYFLVNTTASCVQLWKSDGTEAGTVKVAEPFAGGNAAIDFLTVYNGKLYFSATDGINGSEIWTYDGTTAAMLKDINTTAGAGSNPKGFKEVDGLLFFVATDGSGDKLWVTNGTAEYTKSLQMDNGYTPLSAQYLTFATAGSVLYYAANDASALDNIFSIDANKVLTQQVTFTLSDANGPLVNVSIEFDGTSALTDANGNVTFNDVHVGNSLTYKATKAGYDVFNGTLDVKDAAVNQQVTLVASTYKATFILTDGLNKLEGATVNIGNVTVTSDADGSAVFTGLTAGTYDYTITKAGFVTKTGSVTVTDKDEEIIYAMVLITYNVSFNVSDGTNAIAGAQVTIGNTSVVTGADGKATISGLLPDNYNYSVTAQGYINASGSITVVDADITKDVTLVLTVYTLTFNVSDGAAAIAGADVVVGTTTVVTGADGKAVFTDFLPADYTYTVTKTGYLVKTGSISIVDKDVAVDITLALKTNNISFNVTDGTSAIAGALVTIGNTTVATGADGMALFAGLLPGEYTYSVIAAGFGSKSGTVTITNADVKVDMTLLSDVGFNLAKNGLINVYPNPTWGNISVNLPGSNGKEFAIIVTNIIGKVIIIQNKVIINPTGFDLNLSGFDNGIYYVKIIGGGLQYTAKVVKN